MQLSESIQILATIIEVAVAILALAVMWQKKKIYGGYIAITFILFVIFDIDRILVLNISPLMHAIIFLCACLSMLYAIWLMWKDGPETCSGA